MDKEKYSRKSGGFSEQEEELKELLIMLERNREVMQSIYEELQPDSPQQNSGGQKLRNPLEYSLENLQRRISDESFLHKYVDSCRNIGGICIEVLSKSLVVLPEVCRQMGRAGSSHQAAIEQLEDKDLLIEGFKEKMQDLQERNDEISGMLGKAQSESQFLTHTISDKENQYENESKENRKTFIKAQQQNEVDKKMIKELYESNGKLMESVKELTNQNNFLEQQFSRLEAENAKSQRVIKQFGSEGAEKDEKILGLQDQIDDLMITKPNPIRMPSSDVQEEGAEGDSPENSLNPVQNIIQFDPMPIERVRKNTKCKLSEEVNVEVYKIPSSREFQDMRRSFGVEESDYNSEYEETSIAEDKIQEKHHQEGEAYHKKHAKIPKDPLQAGINGHKSSVFNPYYSHYLLTCQSIKIKEDIEEMLHIDMKPCYAEIIEKRIPMHLWDQWIKNRLREKMAVRQF